MFPLRVNLLFRLFFGIIQGLLVFIFKVLSFILVVTFEVLYFLLNSFLFTFKF
jgi:hypothetical protein